MVLLKQFLEAGSVGEAEWDCGLLEYPQGVRWGESTQVGAAVMGAASFTRQLPRPFWGQGSALWRQDGQCYQTAQLAQRWPPSAAKSGPWAPAAGRGNAGRMSSPVAGKSFPMNPC